MSQEEIQHTPSATTNTAPNGLQALSPLQDGPGSEGGRVAPPGVGYHSVGMNLQHAMGNLPVRANVCLSPTPRHISVLPMSFQMPGQIAHGDMTAMAAMSYPGHNSMGWMPQSQAGGLLPGSMDSRTFQGAGA